MIFKFLYHGKIKMPLSSYSDMKILSKLERLGNFKYHDSKDKTHLLEGLKSNRKS